MPASFSELPVELKSLVWSYINCDHPSSHLQRESVSLAPYACVSRDWQLGIERVTFRRIIIRSSEVSRVKEYIAGHRIAFLRTLCFRIIIPAWDTDDPVSGKKQDNLAFTRSVKDLWAILKTIENGYAEPQALKLRVHLSAQQSQPCLNWRNGPLDFVDDKNLDEADEANRVAKISNPLPLKIMRVPQDLPLIPWVDRLIWSGFSGKYRDIHCAALRRLVSRLHGLTYYEAHLSEDVTQICTYMARDMSSPSLSRLTELIFNFDMRYERRGVLHISQRDSDAFSLAVHRLSQSPNILKVTLRDVCRSPAIRFTPELFGPQLHVLEAGQKPFWPSLQSIIVLITSVSSDGTSLHDCDHPVRGVECTRLDMNKVNPLFMAAARAAQHMPKLLEMRLGIRTQRNTNFKKDRPFCEMAFAAQGYCSKEDVKGEHAALRLNGFISSDSEGFSLHSNEVDLSKPRVSIVMASECTVDSHLEQVWKTSKGEDVDYKVWVPDDDDDEDDDYNYYHDYNRDEECDDAE